MADTPFHSRHPAITAQHVLAECRRELGQRRRFYPSQIAGGRMTQAQADHQLACTAAWASDVERIIAFEAAAAEAWDRYKGNPGDPVTVTLPPPAHAMGWKDRRAALGRELAMRARVYPRRVEESAMTKADADHRIACLAALAARYDDGFDWTASNGERTHWGLTFPLPNEIAQARREWEEHRQAVEARREGMRQEEMAL